MMPRRLTLTERLTLLCAAEAFALIAYFLHRFWIRGRFLYQTLQMHTDFKFVSPEFDVPYAAIAALMAYWVACYGYAAFTARVAGDRPAALRSGLILGLALQFGLLLHDHMIVDWTVFNGETQHYLPYFKLAEVLYLWVLVQACFVVVLRLVVDRDVFYLPLLVPAGIILKDWSLIPLLTQLRALLRLPIDIPPRWFWFALMVNAAALGWLHLSVRRQGGAAGSAAQPNAVLSHVMRHPLTVGVTLVFVAAAVNWYHVYQVREQDFWGFDAQQYVDGAVSILRGKFKFGYDNYWHYLPGYQLFLAGAMQLAERYQSLSVPPKVPFVYYGQAILNVATIALTYDIGRRCFGPIVAVVTTLLLIADGNFLYYVHYVGTENNLTFWMTLSVWLIVLLGTRFSYALCVAAGLAFGCAILTKTTAGPALLVAAGWLVWVMRMRRDAVNGAGLMLACAAVVILAVPRYTMGIDLYFDRAGIHLPREAGTYAVGNNPFGEEGTTRERWEGFVASGIMKNGDDDFGMFRHNLRHPLLWARVLVKKFWDQFNLMHPAYFGGIFLIRDTPFSAILNLYFFVAFGAGLALLYRHGRFGADRRLLFIGLLLGYWTAFHVLEISRIRLGMPVLPLVRLISVGGFLAMLSESVRRQFLGDGLQAAGRTALSSAAPPNAQSA